MNGLRLSSIVNKYKKCPKCGSGYEKTDLQFKLKNDIIEISCACGFFKCVDENNKTIQSK